MSCFGKRTSFLIALIIPLMSAISSANSPPKNFIFRSATYTINIKDGFAAVDGEYQFEALSCEEWCSMYMGEKNSGLYKVSIDGKQAMLDEDGDKILVVLKRGGPHRMKTSFLTPTVQGTGQGSISVPVVLVIGAAVNLTVPSNYENIAIENAIVTESKKSGGSVHIKALLQSMTFLKVAYNVTATAVEPVAEKKASPKIYSSQEILLSISDDMINEMIIFNYDIKHSSVADFSINIPENYDVTGVSGGSAVSYQVESGVLHVTPSSKVSGNYQLRVDLTARQPNLKDGVILPQVKTEGAERESGFVAVESVSSLEVTSSEVKGLVPLDASEVPVDLKKVTKNPIVQAYRFSRHPYEAKLAIVRHEERPVLGAAIDSINAVSTITGDGKSLTRVVFEVRNNNVQYLKIDLPESAEIWSAFLDDQPIKPVKNEKGQTLLPLKKAGLNTNKVSFTLDIVYFAPMQKMTRSGKLTMIFPRTDIPASEMMATLFLPPKYKYSDFAGNMDELISEPVAVVKTASNKPEISSDGTKRGIVVNERNRRVRGAQNQESEGNLAAVMERQNDIEQEFAQTIKSVGYIGNDQSRYFNNISEISDRPATTEALTTASTMPQKPASLGNLPVKFSVPLRGQFIRFTKLLVMKDAPTVSLDYQKKWLVWSWSKFPLFVKIILVLAIAILLIAATTWFWRGPGRKLLVLKNQSSSPAGFPAAHSPPAVV